MIESLSQSKWMLNTCSKLRQLSVKGPKVWAWICSPKPPTAAGSHRDQVTTEDSYLHEVARALPLAPPPLA